MTELRYAVRALRRTPGSTGLAIGVLALGIGATTALAAVSHALLVRPLPFAVTGRPVQVIASTPQEPTAAFAPANYLDLVDRSHVFSHLAAFRSNTYDLTEPGADPERLTGADVTWAFFDVFDTVPIAGRLLQSAADRSSAETRVVLSEALWRRRFSADGSVVGTLVDLNGGEAVVVGVAARSFNWPAGAELWLLASGDLPSPPVELEDLESQRDFHYFGVVARLGARVTQAAAQADVSVIAAELARDFPVTNGQREFRVVTLEEQVAGGTRAPLLMLSAAALLLLLIAWINVTGLQLARGAARATELAVRGALGASRARLARGLITESLVLGVAGALAGVAVAVAVVQGVRLYGANLPRVSEVAVSGPVLALAATLALLCSMLFGAVQAFQGLGTTTRALRAGRGPSRSYPRARAALVVAEVALALVLVAGATLFAQSAAALVSQDPGFDDEAAWQMSLALPPQRYATRETQAAFYRQVLESVRAHAGFGRAAIAFPLPTAGAGVSGQYTVQGQSTPSDPDRPLALFASVSDQYFDTVGIPILRGRDFMQADTATSEPVVVINDTMARAHWPDSDPLSGRVNLGGDGWFRVVGVAADSLHEGPGVALRPLVYMPYDQFTVPFASLVFRPDEAAPDLAPAIREIVRRIDPVLPVGAAATLGSLVWDETESARVRSVVLGAIAGVALLLSAVGLYGLMSFLVEERTREFGVRVALGATPRDLVRAVGHEGVGLAVMGVGVGLFVTWLAARLVAGLLFGVAPTDWVSYSAAAFLLLLVAAAATLLPARRAARVDPVIAMRAE